MVIATSEVTKGCVGECTKKTQKPKKPNPPKKPNRNQFGLNCLKHNNLKANTRLAQAPICAEASSPPPLPLPYN